MCVCVFVQHFGVGSPVKCVSNGFTENLPVS